MRATHDRAKIMARIPGTPRTQRPSTPGTNPALRSSAPAHPMAAGPVTRSRALPLTSTQRDSTGALSAWNRSVDYFTDPKWGWTITEQS